MEGMVNLRKKRPRSDADSMGAGGQPQVRLLRVFLLHFDGLL